MTVDISSPPQLSLGSWLDSVVDEELLVVIERRINRELARTIVANDEQVYHLVTKAIRAFIIYGGDARSAANETSDLLRQAGERYAMARRHHQEITAVFERAWRAVRQQIHATSGDEQLSATLGELLEALRLYFRLLQQQALTGWKLRVAGGPNVRNTPLASAVASTCRTSPRPHPESLDDPHYVAAIAVERGIDLSRPYRAVVATNTLGDLYSLPGVLADRSHTEALVPAAWPLEELEDLLTHQVAVSAPTPLREIRDALHLTQQAAALLSDGSASDPRMVVPSEDLSIALLAHSNRYLSDLLIAKHLEDLGREPAARRVTYGEFALVWIGVGGGIKHVANTLNMPVQTVHSRVKRLREMFGESLSCPTARLEITIALQAVLPSWREAQRPSKPASRATA